MKKLICAVAAAAIVAPLSTAQAITVYKKDGLTFKIKGDWQIQLRQDVGEDQDLDVEYDDLELKNSVEYDVGNGITAFGELDFGFKNAADKSDDDEGPHLEEAYLGFGYEKIDFLFGKTDSAADEFGVDGSKEGTGLPVDIFDADGEGDGDDLLKIEAKFADMVTVIASHEIEADSESSSGNGSFTDIFASVEFEGVTFSAAYQTVEPKESESMDLWGVSLSYDAKVAEVAVDYSVNDTTDTMVWNIFGAVPVQDFTIGLGYQAVEYDETDDEDAGGWYANAIYKFPTQPNVRLFAEVAGTDEDDSDVGFLVGARIRF